MPTHRIAFHFVDESSRDREFWREWLDRAESRLKSVATLGERRPSVQVAAPFVHRRADVTSRVDEAAGLEVARALVGELTALAASTDRSIELLFAAQPLGTITGVGPAAAIQEKLAAWEALVGARPADEPSWEREGYVSIWAGVLPSVEFDRLLTECCAEDKPISPFARELGITFYDHDCLEASHGENRRPLGDVVTGLSFGASFVDLLPAHARDLSVDTVILMFDTDFSQRAKAIARKRLRFVAALPYSHRA